MTEPGPNWKLDLRYGRLTTPYKHFTAIAEGRIGALIHGFECRPGPAFMAIKTWASSADESADMARVIGKKIGFEVNGNTQIYETEASQPPGEKPHGYDIKFTAYDEQ